ncbi:MAG TPA: sulfatase-like hydrolase/transferase [Acidimicrobiales bacterium]|nr:sulfatase-like hydrolase/transferase [Acidimicrobiales bacterium]
MTSPNVIFVVFDTARADAFEPYGAAPGSTPTIADLARRGAAHPQAFANASWTVPSHASMLSGRLPRSAGFQHRGDTKAAAYVEANRRLVAEGQSLPAVMRRAGYETIGVSGNTWISGHGGFDQGFDRFDVVTERRMARLHKPGLRDRLAWRLDAVRAKLDDGAAEVSRVIDDWLARRDRRPFFLFVNLIECHSPYLPPKPFNPLGPADRWRSAAEASRYLNVESIWRCSLGGFDVPDDALERMRVLHAASASQLDDWVARLLSALDQHGLVDETQLVLTSDHGENLGDGELLGHAFSLDNRLIRVPLVTAGPATLPTDGVMSLTRLPRFVAEAAGIDDHPFDDGLPDGVAVAQLDAPGDGDPDGCVAKAAEWGLGPDAAGRLGMSIVCATDGRFKLFRPQGTGARVAGVPEELLVDLGTDPLEVAPVAPVASTSADAAVLAKLRRALDVAAESERPKTPVPTSAAAEDAALVEQLRHLGYL